MLSDAEKNERKWTHCTLSDRKNGRHVLKSEFLSPWLPQTAHESMRHRTGFRSIGNHNADLNNWGRQIKIRPKSMSTHHYCYVLRPSIHNGRLYFVLSEMGSDSMYVYRNPVIFVHISTAHSHMACHFTKSVWPNAYCPILVMWCDFG